MRAVSSEQFAQRLKWRIVVGHRLMVFCDGFAERGECAKTGDEKWLVDAHEVTSQPIPAIKIRLFSRFF